MFKKIGSRISILKVEFGTIYESIKNTGIFFLGSVFSRLISFILLPLYTNNISKSGMGYYDLVITSLSIVIPILFVEIWSGIMRFLYSSKSEEDTSVVVNSSLAIFVVSLLIYLTSSFLISRIFTLEYFSWIVLVGLTQALSTTYQFLARGLRRNIDFAISGILSTLALSVTNFVLIIGFDFDEKALFISLIVGYIVQILYLEIRCKILRLLNFHHIDGAVQKSMLVYTIPLGINSISYWVLSSSSKLVINYFFDLEANGIFAISQKFSAIISLITMAVNYAWQDLAFKNADGKGDFFSKSIKTYWYIFVIGTSLIIPAILIIFPLLVGETFQEAIHYIPIGLTATMLSSYGTVLGNVFGAIKQTKSVLTSTIISSLVNLVLSIILVPVIGIQGANISTLISVMLNIAIRLVVLKKLIKIKIKMPSYLLGLALMGITISIYFTFSKLSNMIWIIVIIFVLIFNFLKYSRRNSENG